jgi:hypothetical protein
MKTNISFQGQQLSGKKPHQFSGEMFYKKTKPLEQLIERYKMILNDEIKKNVQEKQIFFENFLAVSRELLLFHL